MIKTIAIGAAVVAFIGVTINKSYDNIPEVKANAVEVFKQAGFKVEGYEGYTIGNPIGGASVWFTLKRVPDNGVTYHAAIQSWGNEFHIYNLQAVDAIKPQ